MQCSRFCCGDPRMLGRQWSTLEGHLVYHIVTLSHTHGQRVASLRRPEVAGTAEASRFNFVPHQILSGHMIMPLWVGVHNVLQGKRCHSVILLFLFQYICHSVHLQLTCPQCPPFPACMHTLLRQQEAIVLCEQNFSLQVCTSLLQSWQGLLMVAPGDLWCFNSFYSSIHWQWMKWIKPRWKCKSSIVYMCKFSSVFIHCVDIGRNVTWSSCPGYFKKLGWFATQ